MGPVLDRPILVVDDDPAIRELIEQALGDEGYAVLTAEHGAAALQIVASTTPAVILLDMRMPVMDGWTFARQYRAAYQPAAPIVVCTAARDAGERAAQIGADGTLPKPFKLDDLLDTVERFAGAA
jgi:CheY-like chemotaxis protein